LGGSDDHLKLHAGTGNDWVGGTTIPPEDRLKGGDGTDTLALEYTTIVLTDRTITGFEVFAFRQFASIVTADGTVAAGKALTVDASYVGTLSRRQHLTFDGSAETDGFFDIEGGRGKDVIAGGALDDHIVGGNNGDLIAGGGGADTLDGGLHRDSFSYAGVEDSTGTIRDTILNLNAAKDKFVLPVAVTGIDEAVAVGSLSEATFDADMETAIGAANLDAGFAVVFTPSAGDLSGRIFLVIDANGTAGYQTDADFVIELVDPFDLDELSAGNFI
jgi:hypothetical protein